MFTQLIISYFLVGTLIAVWASVVTWIDLNNAGFIFSIFDVIPAMIIGIAIWPIILYDRIRKLLK